ncbi:hypothetical protein JNUCC74_07070 [Cerasibacillus sp. JNUCC 74]
MLLVGDILLLLVIADTKNLNSLILWVLIGIIVSYYTLERVDDKRLKPIIGVIVLAMIGLNFTRHYLGKRFNQLLPKSAIFTMFSEILAVLFTMVDNAAHRGSDNDDLFTSKKCAQNEFVGTDARFFFLLML